MITLEELASKLGTLEKRVDRLDSKAEEQDRLNVRLFEMMTEVRDDVATLRRHAVAAGRKLEEMDARIDKLDGRIGRLEARIDKLDARLDKLDARMDRLEARMDKLDTNFTAFQHGLPAMIAETMREVLRENKG